MGLIERIKSVLGLGTSASSSQSAPSSTDGPSPGDGVDVTVEHEPATTSEDAVKGTDTAGDAEPTPTEPEPDETDEAGDDAAAGDASDGVGEESDELVEEAEPAESTDDDETIEEAETESAESTEDAETTGEAEAAEDDEAAPDPEEPAPDAELEDIKGIGPTYGERLRSAGVDGIGGLAAADPADIAEETDIAESRVEDWVEQAKLY